MTYKKGEPPAPHKLGCRCFRCTRIPWTKGKAGTGLIKAWNKGKEFEQIKGNKHWNWKGGKQKSGNGYTYLYMPEHPNADNRGRIFEHRYIMEQALGRRLKKKEVVHHINRKPSDNRLENLELYDSGGKHLSKELKGRNNYWNKDRIGTKYDKENN